MTTNGTRLSKESWSRIHLLTAREDSRNLHLRSPEPYEAARVLRPTHTDGIRQNACMAMPSRPAHLRFDAVLAFPHMVYSISLAYPGPTMDCLRPFRSAGGKLRATQSPALGSNR